MEKILKTKNSNNILLSISVITYNQPDEARRILLEILPQMQSEVEIIINDNSSNIETQELIKNNFSESFIRYFKNDEPRTFDMNVLRAVERAQGEYVWVFGDNEIAPGAINAILKIIKENKYNFIFTNFCMADQKEKTPVVILDSDEIFNNGSIVLEKIANVLGFVSSIILRKSCLLNIDKKELNKFIGTEFINLYLALYVLSSPGLFYACSVPYVYAHAVSSEKKSEEAKQNGFNVFVIHMLNIVNAFKGKFDKKSIKKILPKNFGHIWRGILVENVKEGSVPIKQLFILFKYYWNFPEFWIALPFFLMPRFINVFFYNLYKKITGNNKYLKQKLAKVPWF